MSNDDNVPNNIYKYIGICNRSYDGERPKYAAGRKVKLDRDKLDYIIITISIRTLFHRYTDFTLCSHLLLLYIVCNCTADRRDAPCVVLDNINSPITNTWLGYNEWKHKTHTHTLTSCVRTDTVCEYAVCAMPHILFSISFFHVYVFFFFFFFWCRLTYIA